MDSEKIRLSKEMGQIQVGHKLLRRYLVDPFVFLIIVFS